MRVISVVVLALALTGCAGFCQRHETECVALAVVATAIVVGSAEAGRGHRYGGHDKGIGGPNCTAGQCQ